MRKEDAMTQDQLRRAGASHPRVLKTLEGEEVDALQSASRERVKALKQARRWPLPKKTPSPVRTPLRVSFHNEKRKFVHLMQIDGDHQN